MTSADVGAVTTVGEGGPRVVHECECHAAVEAVLILRRLEHL